MPDTSANVAVEMVEGAPARITLRGTVTVEHSELLLASARRVADAARDVIVDTSELERIDAAGIQILLALRADTASRGLRLSFIAPGPEALAWLRLAGLGSLLDGDRA